MAHCPYYAVVYAYGQDGEEIAYMPCFNHEQVMTRASKYDPKHYKIRVVGNGFPPYWLRLTKDERAKYVLPPVDDFEPGFVRDSLPECKESREKDHAQSTARVLPHPEAIDG